MLKKLKELSKEQKIIGSIVLLFILFLFFTLLTNGTTEPSQAQTKANDSVKQSSQVKQSSSSSTSSSSSETSSKIEKWSPTGHIAVDAYLNTPQIKIILRAKALREVSHKLSNTDKLYEVEAEVIGIEEKDEYREYNITGKKLLIRTPESLAVKMNELMVYTGNTVSLEKYDSIDKGSLVISEVRKTEKAQEEEKASIEASKSKEEERKASSREKEQEQASSHTTTTPTQSSTPAPQSNLRPFKNCTEARKAGRVNIPASDPQYGPWLDRDKDGYGCDE
ncbi:excalibur calcium-binding domain-containing protein [Streptococcus sp. CL6.22]|uniref:excalibur calcium-binding domain-containing protein n=1 Tax=Streptococcus sp. CL6.22 TaxID=3392239 RepID=UPI0021B6C5C7|nr:excalibur calcium-binding domain-containing protein [Streptococcus mitis]